MKYRVIKERHCSDYQLQKLINNQWKLMSFIDEDQTEEELDASVKKFIKEDSQPKFTIIKEYEI